MPRRTTALVPLARIGAAPWHRIGRATGIAIGLVMLAGAGAVTFSQPVQDKPNSTDLAIMITGGGLVIAYGPGWRRFFILASAVIGLAGTALFLFALYHLRLLDAANAAAVALVNGFIYWLLTADLLALLRQVGSQLASKWRLSAKRDLFVALALLMISVVGLYALRQDAARHPSLLTPFWSVVGWIIVGLCGLAAFGGLWSVAWGLIGCLIPSFQSGLDAVAAAKVHGDAGYASRGQVDAALRDEDHGGGYEPRFKD